MNNNENKIPTREELEKNSVSQPNSHQVKEPIIVEIPEESQAIPQKSIVIFPTVILLIVVSIFAGYLLYQNRQLKKALKINSFDACVKENGIIQESYPRVCVTKDGRRFTEEIKETLTPTLSVEKPESTTIPLEKEDEAASYPSPTNNTSNQL